MDSLGILNHALNVVKKHNVNLTRIKSKPSKNVTGGRSVDVYMDFNGDLKDENVSDMLRDLSELS